MKPGLPEKIELLVNKCRYLKQITKEYDLSGIEDHVNEIVDELTNKIRDTVVQIKGMCNKDYEDEWVTLDQIVS